MNKNNTYNHKHLTLSDRIFIQQSLNDHLRFNTIAKSLNKDPSTISKEVRRSMEIQPSSHYKGNDCKHFDSCTESKLCSKGCFELCRFCNQVNCWEYCSNYEPSVCPGIKTPPYVCNGCTNVNSCSYEKHFYNAAHAQKLYETTLTQSRKGINMSPDELQKINELISPLIRSGQPLSHIYYNHSKEISCCRRTVYNYLDQGLFEVRNIDLPRRVRYKLMKKNKAANPVNYNYRSKRTYKDFEKYSEAFPDYEIVELDTVKGSREAGKCLLTMFFRKSSFMLIFYCRLVRKKQLPKHLITSMNNWDIIYLLKHSVLFLLITDLNSKILGLLKKQKMVNIAQRFFIATLMLLIKKDV